MVDVYIDRITHRLPTVEVSFAITVFEGLTYESLFSLYSLILNEFSGDMPFIPIMVKDEGFVACLSEGEVVKGSGSNTTDILPVSIGYPAELAAIMDGLINSPDEIYCVSGAILCLNSLGDNIQSQLSCSVVYNGAGPILSDENFIVFVDSGDFSIPQNNSPPLLLIAPCEMVEFTS